MSKREVRFLTLNGETKPISGWVEQYPYLSKHSINTRYNLRSGGNVDITDAQILFGQSCVPKEVEDKPLTKLVNKFSRDVYKALMTSKKPHFYCVGHDIEVMPQKILLGNMNPKEFIEDTNRCWINDKELMFSLLNLRVEDAETLYLTYFEKAQLLMIDV